MRCAIQLSIALALAGCGPELEPEPEPSIEPVFGDVNGWSEERDCRFTHEHELRYIRVVADDAAQQPYRALDPSTPYPVGATLVKVEYDDDTCTKIVGYTAMQKQNMGFSAVGNDWRWQRLNADREVVQDGELTTCIGCHSHHCTPPSCGYPDCGYDLTCGEEL